MAKRKITPSTNPGELIGIYNKPGQVKPSGYITAEDLVDETTAESIEYEPIGDLTATNVKEALDQLSSQQAVLSFPTFKSYGIGDIGNAGSHDMAGFISSPVTDATITVGGVATQTYGSAGDLNGGHFFIVPDGPASGACVLTVTGDSITDAGVLTEGDSEIIVADGTAMVVDTYYETAKKWVGQVTITISGTASSAATFNYGLCKYEDFGNRDYVLTDAEFVARAGANESTFRLRLLHVQATGAFIYHATAFDPFAGATLDSNNVYTGYNNFSNGESFALKLSGLNETINGSGAEGVIVRLTHAVNNSIQYANLHLGVQFQS
jgi:hypothetical protein